MLRLLRQVNKRYKLLEIEQDALYKCMLLLKKKKYAAIKLEKDAAGRIVEVQLLCVFACALYLGQSCTQMTGCVEVRAIVCLNMDC